MPSRRAALLAAGAAWLVVTAAAVPFLLPVAERLTGWQPPRGAVQGAAANPLYDVWPVMAAVLLAWSALAGTAVRVAVRRWPRPGHPRGRHRA